MIKRLPLRWFWPTVLTVVLIIGFYPVMEKYSQSFKFVDENEHLVMAWLLTKGYHLYTDFPNNHQPIPYFASFGIQHVFQIDNVFMLVKRHREVIFVWSLVWWWLFLRRFGAKMIIPIVLFETIKYFTLGNEFLAEAIIVYPLAYLNTDLLLPAKPGSKLYSFGLGLLTAFIQLTLLPMALVLLLITAIRLAVNRFREWKPFLFGLAVMVVLVFLVVPLQDYLVEVKNALVYSLPGLTPVSTTWQLWRLPGLPLLYIPYFKDPIGQAVWMMSSWWLLALVILGLMKKKKQFWVTLGALAAWLLTNTRVAEADVYFYQAFHLTPWLLVGLSGGVVALGQVMLWIGKLSRRVIIGFYVILLGLFFSNRQLPLYTNIEPMTEHYVQYTPITQAAETINSLKQPGDRLMVIPNESLIYYLTDLEPAKTNMFTFYDWQLQVPKNRRLFFQTLAETPPAFIVYNDDGSSYSPFMNEYLKQHYLELMQYPNVYLYEGLADRRTDQ